jgi:hypothetical protein
MVLSLILKISALRVDATTMAEQNKPRYPPSRGNNVLRSMLEYTRLFKVAVVTSNLRDDRFIGQLARGGKKRKGTTAPRIPAWSPTVVLTERHFG